MALTSIFLSSVRIVKEFRDTLFKEIKFSRSGKTYFFTEVSIPEIDKNSRIDGMIITVVKDVIKGAVFLEMKNKNNGIDKNQIEKYIELAKKLRVDKLVTVSNEFVADSSLSPVAVRLPKSISMYHFSWTYLMTIGQLLLFDNEENITNEDQEEVMKEVLHYMENPVSGVSGYTSMKPGWKELAENVSAQKPLKNSDIYIEDAVLSWYEEEKDMALYLSRSLGVLVKSTSKNKDSLKKDIAQLVKHNYISGILSVKNSVSDIKVFSDFERRSVSMSVKVIPPLDKGTKARITWISKQLQNCKKQSESIFNKIESDIWVEADIKFGKSHIKIKLSELDTLADLSIGKEIQAFHIVLISSFGANFASVKKFVERIERMIIEYYAGIVQHMINWNRNAPKLESID
ncbi:hypothetical protein [Reichenbachiella faecimaris]|nr:hypothetical protein [Reichenbachiella faecimaris]